MAPTCVAASNDSSSNLADRKDYRPFRLDQELFKKNMILIAKKDMCQWDLAAPVVLVGMVAFLLLVVAQVPLAMMLKIRGGATGVDALGLIGRESAMLSSFLRGRRALAS